MPTLLRMGANGSKAASLEHLWPHQFWKRPPTEQIGKPGWGRLGQPSCHNCMPAITRY
jgi:hypothetical protein